MIINGYRCDGDCGKEHLLEPLRIADPWRIGQFYDAMPDGWFILHRGNITADGKPWLFCSRRCLRHWLLHVSLEADSLTTGTINRYKAPSLSIECDYEGVKYKGTIDAMVEEST